ncbi:MAG: KOW motif-containing protein [Nanoarchaeota archaeon]|nr:KOW motif-containing protein [Nanoarchaeota archaeon]MBU0977789.1 KOW motif-containing protein [Nanoarchaeota archaeon]
MHQTRAQVSKKIPIARKGTKYVARPLGDRENSVPIVIAVRDMLHLAKTAKEVRKMIQQKLLKINGKEAKDYRDSIRLLSLFEADKTYILTLDPTRRFVLEETKQKERPCKVVNKKVLKGKKIQLNLHDGSNILSDNKKINTQDTIYLDAESKIKKHLSFDKGRACLITRGRFIGQKGIVEKAEKNKVLVKIKNLDVETNLDKTGVILI